MNSCNCRVAYRRQFTAHCTGNMVYFPYDKLNCSLRFVLRNLVSADIRLTNMSLPYSVSDQ